MCLRKVHKKNEKARNAIGCCKIMYLNTDDMRVNSLCYPKGDGYSIGDVMLPSARLSKRGFLNRMYINKLSVLRGEVVHSYSLTRRNFGFFERVRDDKRVPVAVMCEIPNGETYWRGWGDEYGSLSLKIKGIRTDLWRIDIKYKKQYHFSIGCDGESLITAKMLFTFDELIHYIDTHNVGISSYSIYSHDALTGDSEFVYAKVLE